jgi:hypothetical protein
MIISFSLPHSVSIHTIILIQQPFQQPTDNNLRHANFLGARLAGAYEGCGDWMTILITASVS